MEAEPSDPQRVAAAGHSVSGWPVRTQRLIGEVRSLCRTWLPEPLQLCLGDFDRRLQAISERTRSHVEQQRYLATRQRLVQERQSFEARFVTSVDQAFADIGVPAAELAPASRRHPLSLLDPLEHELTAAMDQLVARSEARCGPLLVELSYRFAVLVGAPPLDAETLPLGPQIMAKAFRDATASLGLPTEHDLLLLHSLESTLMQGLTPLYRQVNEHLQADGILPELRAFPLPRAPARASRPAADTAEPAGQPAIETAPRRPPEADRRTTPAPAPDDRLQHLRSWLSASSRGLETGLEASTEQVQAALVTLQRRLVGVDGSGEPVLYDGAKLRDEVLRTLRAASARSPGGPLGLGPEHRDILELVARLVAQIDLQLAPGNAAHRVLGRLQLPLLRMAIASPTEFFNRREHPAQQLLGTMLETARDWVDDETSEAARHLSGQLEQLAEQLYREPPMAAVHARLLATLEQQLTQLKRKAQVAEKRHAEAMQGRERLEQARARAAELMADRFARTQPKGLLRALLDRAWSDVLALTLLRQGEQSDAFASRLVVTDQLLGLLPLGNPQRLQEEVETGLAQIGMQGEEAAQVAQRLLGAVPGAKGDVPSATDLAMRLKQRQRLGEAHAGDTAASVNPVPATEQEQHLHDRLQRMPPGHWFEFLEPDGRRLQRKLVWSSPSSGRTLLVNRHGQRAEEPTLLDLARAMVAGRVRELAPDSADALLGQAWRALGGSLQQSTQPSETKP